MVSRASGYLLDTQILIWFFSNELQKDILQIVKNPENVIYLSVINVWEIILKIKKGKLKVPVDINEAIKKSGFDTLDISMNHVFELQNLPEIHADPFDRMLIAQARAEKLTLISSDKKVGKYKVKILHA